MTGFEQTTNRVVRGRNGRFGHQLATRVEGPPVQAGATGCKLIDAPRLAGGTPPL